MLKTHRQPPLLLRRILSLFSHVIKDRPIKVMVLTCLVILAGIEIYPVETLQASPKKDSSATTKQYRSLAYKTTVTSRNDCTTCWLSDYERTYCSFKGEIQITNTSATQSASFLIYFDVNADELREKPCTGLASILPKPFTLKPKESVKYSLEVWYETLHSWEVVIKNYQELEDSERWDYPGRNIR